MYLEIIENIKINYINNALFHIIKSLYIIMKRNILHFLNSSFIVYLVLMVLYLFY